MTRYRNEGSGEATVAAACESTSRRLSSHSSSRSSTNEDVIDVVAGVAGPVHHHRQQNQMKRLRRTLTFLNLNRKRAAAHVYGNKNRRLSLGIPAGHHHHHHYFNSPISSSGIHKPREFASGLKTTTTTKTSTTSTTKSKKTKKTIKATTRENLGAIKQQLKRYADEVSAIRVMKRKNAATPMTPSNRVSKRRDVISSASRNQQKHLGMHSFLGWDADLREYIENQPQNISRVINFFFFFIFLDFMGFQ